MLFVGITGLFLAVVIKKIIDSIDDSYDHDFSYLYDTDFITRSKFDYEKMLPPVKPRAHLRIISRDEDELFI